MKTQGLTMREFTPDDTENAEHLAIKLGYKQTAYTSTSALWGLFCLAENPKHHIGRPHTGGCIIATEELGLLFVQDIEDITGEVEL